MVAVRLLLDGVLVDTVELDDSGYASGNVLVDVGAIGTHVLTAERGDYTTVTSGTGTGSFNVLALASPPSPPVDPNPVYVSPVVNRWQFQDPVTDAVYAFPINPKETGTPLAPRQVAERATTTGVAISHEGAPQPFSWTFTGTILTEAHYDAFRAWADRKHRIWLTDDLDRRYEIRINDFAHSLAKPGQAHNGAYFGTYVMTTTVFGVT